MQFQIFFRARPLSFWAKSKVEAELDRLQREGIIKLVEFSEWASPIVPVPKGEKSEDVRNCGDYKLTINPVSELDAYPLPRAEDLLATLANGKTYSRVDLKKRLFTAGFR